MPDSAAPLGQQIDHYTIQNSLGGGGMADVYLAWDGHNQWPVALKLMKAAAMKDPRLEERFRREVAITMKLRHPHLVQVYSWGEIADGRLYLVMEYIDGGSLAGLIEQHISAGKTMPPQQAAYLMRRVAGAIAYAHSQGVIHRDLKPGNVLIRSGNGEPVVTDLGIATIAGASRLTGTMEALGTPHYMAPEQASNSSPTDERSDVYAMGVMLCEMLSGRLPFEGETSWAILSQKINKQAPTLAQLQPGIDPTQAAIVDTCLQRDPARRYASADALAAALDRVLPSPVPPITPPSGTPRFQTPYTPATPVKPNGKSRSASPLLWIVGAAAALLLLWGVVSLLGGRRSTETVPPSPPTAAIAENPAAAESAGRAVADAPVVDTLTETPRPTSTPADVLTETGLVEAGLTDGPSDDIPASDESLFVPEPAAVLVPDEIVFQSNRDGDYEIYIMNTDGSNQRQLTFNSAEDRYPRVSTDGRWIVFESDRDGRTFEIYSMARDGTGTQRLTFNTRNDRLPTWSPDGSQIAFSRWTGNDSELFIIDRDGQNERQVTFTDVDEGHVSWSPTDQLIYNADRVGASYWQLYTINADGSGWRRITNTTFDEWSPEWSPDGSRVVFLSELESRTNPGIYTMDADGGNVRQLYNGPTLEWAAVWSADGRQIVFAVDQTDDTADIYLIDADGGGPVFLTERGSYPSWAAGLTSSADIPAPVERDAAPVRDLDVRVVVDGTQPRTFTGISVNAGQRILIDYVGGTWRAGATETWPYVDAAGDLQVLSKSSFPIPDSPLVSLIAGIGNGAPFYVGTGIGITSDATGELWLGPNDDDTADNLGDLTVRIRVAAP